MRTTVAVLEEIAVQRDTCLATHATGWRRHAPDDWFFAVFLLFDSEVTEVTEVTERVLGRARAMVTYSRHSSRDTLLLANDVTV